MTADAISIRPAEKADARRILEFIRALAEYEKLLHEVVATEEVLTAALFGENPVAHVIIGEINGSPAGFALYFYNFSTFLGRPGIYLEDLYVDPAWRGQGLGKALILHLARKAHDEGCGRMDWAVLDWNRPSIEFYRSLGATAQEEWTGYRLDRAVLAALVKE